MARGGDDRGAVGDDLDAARQRSPASLVDGDLERQGSSSQTAQSRQTDGHHADRANWHDKRWGTDGAAPGTVHRGGLDSFASRMSHHVALAPFLL